MKSVHNKKILCFLRSFFRRLRIKPIHMEIFYNLFMNIFLSFGEPDVQYMDRKKMVL